MTVERESAAGKTTMVGRMAAVQMKEEMRFKVTFASLKLQKLATRDSLVHMVRTVLARILVHAGPKLQVVTAMEGVITFAA